MNPRFHVGNHERIGWLHMLLPESERRLTWPVLGIRSRKNPDFQYREITILMRNQSGRAVFCTMQLYDFAARRLVPDQEHGEDGREEAV